MSGPVRQNMDCCSVVQDVTKNCCSEMFECIVSIVCCPCIAGRKYCAYKLDQKGENRVIGRVDVAVRPNLCPPPCQPCGTCLKEITCSIISCFSDSATGICNCCSRIFNPCKR